MGTLDVLGRDHYHQLLHEATAGFPEAQERLVQQRDVTEQLYAHKADSTVGTYQRRLQRYKTWCQELKLPAFRETTRQAAGQICMFIIELASTGLDGAADRPSDDEREHYAVNTMRGYVTAIGTSYQNNGHANPTTDPSVRNVMRAYALHYGSPTTRAHAFSLDELTSMAVSVEAACRTSRRDQLMAMLVTDPRCPLPRAAVAQLRWDQITIGTNGLAVTTSRGRAVVPADQDPRLDPVRLAQAWSLEMAATRPSSDGRLAPHDHPSPYVFPGRTPDRPMTSENVRKTVHRLVAAAGVEYLTGLGRGQWKLAAADRSAVAAALNGPRPAGQRDRALTTSGWWAQLRAAELSTLRWGDITITDTEVHYRLTAGTKTDPYRDGESVVVARNHDITDPGQSLIVWRDTLARLLGRDVGDHDPVFWGLHTSAPSSNLSDRAGRRIGMTAEAINEAIQRLSSTAGIEAPAGRRISSHGLRAGGTTEMLLDGKPATVVADFGRRKSTESMLIYHRPRPDAPGRNPTAGLVTRRLQAHEPHPQATSPEGGEPQDSQRHQAGVSPSGHHGAT